jgi:hypothetical protein
MRRVAGSIEGKNSDLSDKLRGQAIELAKQAELLLVETSLSKPCPSLKNCKRLQEQSRL